MTRQQPWVIAHRGASDEAPENTLGAFALALEQGSDAFELDVHLSQDGHIVVIHDYAVDRTTNGSGLVSELSLSELQKFDAGSWFGAAFAGERIPTLEEVFDLTPANIVINVEIKGGIGKGIEEKLAALLRKRERLESVVVSSFDYKCLEKLKEVEPAARIGLLYDLRLFHWRLPKAIDAEVYSLHPQYRKLDAEDIADAKAKGLAVFPWTVNEEKHLRKMIDYGATGIITDYPGRLRQILNGL